MNQFLTWLNRLLVVDVFVVIAGFLWFAIAILGRSLGVALGLDIWHQLWMPLFSPAIGILILGAIVSGVTNKVSQRFDSNHFK